MNSKLGRRIKKRRLAAFLLLFPLVTACSPKASDTSATVAVDPPPSQAEQAMMREAGPSGDVRIPAAAAVPEDSVTVYLQDRNGYLAPMTLRIGSPSESVQATAETALIWLTNDARRADQLPEGFSAVLPEGTQVENVKLDSDAGSVSIDFADPLPGLPVSKERKMLEALVWSMTELPGIDKVRLSVAGKPVRSLPDSGLPVDEVLTRGIGINLEHEQGVQMTRSMAVTLYFAARSENGDGYFIPVTRLIDRNKDRMHAALEQLILGPMDKKAMRAVMAPELTVDRLIRQADTVNVSLHEEGWAPDDGVPSEMMEALVLTMTEATGAPQVKVAMNGTGSFVDSQQRSYERPVIRPVVINSLER